MARRRRQARSKPKQRHYLYFTGMIMGLLLISTMLFGAAIVQRASDSMSQVVGLTIILVSIIMLYYVFWKE